MKDKNLDIETGQFTDRSKDNTQDKKRGNVGSDKKDDPPRTKRNYVQVDNEKRE